jgi:hypothetical protein
MSSKVKGKKNEDEKPKLEDKLPPGIDDLQEVEPDIHEDINENENNEEEQIKVKEPSEVEEYLQNKLKGMNIQMNILDSISNGLGNSLNTIKSDYKDDQFSIRDIPNNENIKRILEKSEDGKNKKTIEQNIISKKNFKKLKEYKEERDKLNEKVLQLENQKNLIETNTDRNNKINESIQKEELKKMKRDLSNYNERICQLDYQIKNIIAEESKLNKNEQIKNFIDNFKRDTEIAQIKIRKYKKQHEINEKLFKDNEIKYNEKREKYLLKEKKKEENLKKIVAQRIEKEKEKREKLKQTNEERKKEEEELLKKMEDNKYINRNKNELLHNKIEKNYLKRKELMYKKGLDEYFKGKKKHYIDLSTLKSDEEVYLEKKEKKIEEIKEKYRKEKEEWEKNKSSIPEFKIKNSDKVILQTRQIFEDEKNHKKKIEELKKEKEDYAELIRYDKKPEEDERSKLLKSQRLENIKKLTEKKIVKDTLYDYKKKRILLKKRDPNKPSKYSWQLKLEEIDENNPLGTSVEIQKALIKKPRRIMLSTEFEKKKNIPNQKKDFLPEAMSKKNITEINSDNENSGNQNTNWNKLLKDKNASLFENLENVKNKADYLEQKASENEKILVVNGGFSRNPKLGKKVTNLLINSIHAKMCILDNFDS